MNGCTWLPEGERGRHEFTNDAPIAARLLLDLTE